MWRRRARNILISAVFAAIAAGTLTAAPAETGATREALVAHGIGHYRGRAMREGLAELEAAAEMAPGWAPAQRAYAFALVRAGMFEPASALLTEILGAALASGMEGGEISGSSIPDAGIDAEAVLGLAIVRDETGRYREADRLYRCYADLLGAATPEAAGAFWRLGQMYERSGVKWGSASAERARALALDPDVGRRLVLPSFPDATSVPELEPYTRDVEPAEGRGHPPDGYDSLPLLIRWSAPAGIDISSPSLFQRTAVAEMLVDETGRVLEVVLPQEAREGTARGEATVAAAREWVFRPAAVGGAPATAWITLSVLVPVGAAPDTLPPTVPSSQDSTTRGDDAQ